MFSGKIEDYILFEDKEIIVCRKPAGIAVQNARIGAMDLESSLKNYLAMQAGGGRRIPYLAVIHRLDQPVEGILVFGKTPEAEIVKCTDYSWKDGKNLSGSNIWKAGRGWEKRKSSGGLSEKRWKIQYFFRGKCAHSWCEEGQTFL